MADSINNRQHKGERIRPFTQEKPLPFIHAANNDLGSPSYGIPVLGGGGGTDDDGTVKQGRGRAFTDGGYTYNSEGGFFEKSKGLGWFVTGLFVVGDLAGGGIVALPTAIVQAGFVTGLLLTFAMGIAVTYTSILLGKCWVMLQRRWPMYTASHCRKPYPEIGYRALGPGIRNAVSACIDINQFGVAVVYLLLSSKNLHDSLKAFFDTNLSFCFIVIVVATCLLPVTFLKSPQDFWGAVVLAMFTTSVAVVLILVGSSMDYSTCAPHMHTPSFNPSNYFLAMGTFIFAYGGHAAFPTIQHDMRRPSDFTKSSILAFSIIAVMYTPVSILGYFVYGDGLRESIINSLQVVWIQQAVNMLITIHCILTLTIVFNPINQEAEDFFEVPHHFCLKRVLVRSGMMLAVVFVAESLPTFGPLLDFLGGSVLCLTSLVFPCLFYILLSTLEAKEAERAVEARYRPSLRGISQAPTKEDVHGAGAGMNGVMTTSQTDDQYEWPTIREAFERIDKVTLFCCASVMLFGIVCGGGATFSAVREMSYAKFIPPCYVMPFLSNYSDPNAGGHTNCCGHNQSISRWGDPHLYCSEADMEFYT